MTLWKSSILLFSMSLLMACPRTCSFVAGSPCRRPPRSAPGVSLAESSSSDRRQQEQQLFMEELSRIGADKIASLGIAERTKRAMLAEALEDRIFDLTEQLDQLVVDDTVPVENRDKAVELARQTKVLQNQYNELVSGEPSSLLGAMEAATKPGDNNKENED